MSETEKVPRGTKEITEEYSKLIAQAGQTQYKIKVHEGELSTFNQRIYELNLEQAERNKLDAQTKAQEAAVNAVQ